MESSSLWTSIYRKVSNFGNFVSIYIYIYIEFTGEKASTSPKSYRRWVSDQSPVWMGQVFKLKANFPLLKEGPGEGRGGSSNWIRRRYELRYLEMEMYQCGRDSSSSASSTQLRVYLSLSLSFHEEQKKANHREGREREREFRVADRIYRIYGI